MNKTNILLNNMYKLNKFNIINYANYTILKIDKKSEGKILRSLYEQKKSENEIKMQKSIDDMRCKITEYIDSGILREKVTGTRNYVFHNFGESNITNKMQKFIYEDIEITPLKDGSVCFEW